MARKTRNVIITDEGRDKGKVFIIKEMSALRVEDWATRALLALANNGGDIPEDVAKGGLAAVSMMGLQLLSALKYEDARPLLDQMMECVTIMPNPAQPIVVRGLIEDDIEEVKTLLTLRKEIFELHTGFSFADAKSKLAAAPPSPAPLNTPTFLPE